jgi:hypothetical protein
MVIRILLSDIRLTRPRRARLVRFRHVLESAIQTPGYALRLHAARLGTRAAVAAVASLEEGLARLAWIPSTEWQPIAPAFENRQARREPGRRFAYPFRPSPHVVLLDESHPTPLLSGDQTLAGGAGMLCEYARRITRGEVARPRLEHALLSFAGSGAGYLTPEDRDLLWGAFHVPVFEQYLDWDGHVMATECEAHEGLHISPETAIFEEHEGEVFLTSLAALRRPALRLGTGFRGAIDESVCACGRSGPRLRELRAVGDRSVACAAD